MDSTKTDAVKKRRIISTTQITSLSKTHLQSLPQPHTNSPTASMPQNTCPKCDNRIFTPISDSAKLSKDLKLARIAIRDTAYFYTCFASLRFLCTTYLFTGKIMSPKHPLIALCALLIPACAEVIDATECINGSRQCDENAIFLCSQGVWTFEQSCGSTKTCDPATWTCLPIPCTNGTTKCQENTVVACINSAWVIVETCRSNQTCALDRLACVPQNATSCIPQCIQGIWTQCDAYGHASQISCADEGKICGLGNDGLPACILPPCTQDVCTNGSLQTCTNGILGAPSPCPLATNAASMGCNQNHSACAIESCQNGFTLSGNTCVKDGTPCTQDVCTNGSLQTCTNGTLGAPSPCPLATNAASMGCNQTHSACAIESCQNGYILSGNACTLPKSCTNGSYSVPHDAFGCKDSSTYAGCSNGEWIIEEQCTTSVANASPVCANNACAFQCHEGFSLSNGACIAPQTTKFYTDFEWIPATAESNYTKSYSFEHSDYTIKAVGRFDNLYFIESQSVIIGQNKNTNSGIFVSFDPTTLDNIQMDYIAWDKGTIRISNGIHTKEITITENSTSTVLTKTLTFSDSAVTSFSITSTGRVVIDNLYWSISP